MEYMIGQIILFPYNFVPREFLPCNGMKLSINQYTSLYALIGSKFGGDDRTYFNLPNLNDAVPYSGMIYCMCFYGAFPQRS